MDDLYTIPSMAVRRPGGCGVPASRTKLDHLFPPLSATGIPMGGVGTGSITRSSDGQFSRWTQKGGGIRQFSMPATGFLLRVHRPGESPEARALQPAPGSGELASFDFEPAAPEWGGLFPFAWHRHAPVRDVEAECLSFSPVIPGDLSSSTLPIAIFRWRLTNRGNVPADVSLALTFANLNGWFGDFGEGRPGRVSAGCYNHSMATGNFAGVILDRRRTSDCPPEGTGQWAIAVAAEGATHSETVCFDGTGGGGEFWEPFQRMGDAPDLGSGWLTESGFRETSPAHPAAGVSGRMRIQPGKSMRATAVLAWDLPVIQFGQGRRWFRYYTDQFGRDGRNARRLVELALQFARRWEERIAAWHGEVADEFGSEPHRAGMAINEAYFLVGGMSVLTSGEGASDGRSRFGIIECPEYALYNTLDLWVYAEEAVSRFFPELAAGVADDYIAHLRAPDSAMRRHRWHGTLFPVSRAGAAAHDVGGPGEDPFETVNSYTYRNPIDWKDLNCYLVLCILQTGLRIGGDWRRARFGAVRELIDHLQQYDRDGDGLIENEGIPDQTFDNVPMLGPSSYCGGFWVAALLAAASMAREAGQTGLANSWAKQARRASVILHERLFDGACYRVDTDGPLSGACFIGQLTGPFLARRLGLGDVVPEAAARSALGTIYETNFLDAGGGEGAVSIARIPSSAVASLPHQDDTSFQTSEIQPGFNFSLAAQLDSWGLVTESDTLRRALRRELYERRNLVYQTPAAFDRGELTCRAIMNMRPLSVWWMS